MSNKYVSIIVPTFNDWVRLRLCVSALSAQTYPKEFFNVIIVNNNPDDTMQATFILPENFEIITEPKLGSNAARNAALQIAQGEIIGFTDSDCIPDKNWIRHAIDHFQNDPSCSRIAGRVSVFPKKAEARVAEKHDWLFAFRQKRYVDDYGTCVTANVFTYKPVFDNVGLFNDTLMSFGDLDWGSKAYKAGFRTDYAENVVANHPAQDLAELMKKEKRLAGGQEKFNKGKRNKLVIFARFLDDMRPCFRGELQFIHTQGTNLTAMEKLSALMLRFRLIYIKA
jgi:cellulose synthase/poly-beta-1,6-N-acetylglucosamine synthase-like glycosyltransferase